MMDFNGQDSDVNGEDSNVGTDAATVAGSIELLKSVSVALASAADALDQSKTGAVTSSIEIDRGIDFNDQVRDFEVGLIQRALKQTGGNQKKAARILNLKHTTLHTKIKRYSIPVHQF
jgi:transcriptional regulator with GAF, ATPase, and Fis domain